MSDPGRRPLGQLTLLALGLNGVVGVGIFFVPSAVARQVPGTFGATAYAVTAVMLLPVALAFARLGPRFDEDGGPYLYARAAFGPRPAYVVGWLTYVSAVLSSSAVIRGLGEALTAPGTHLARWGATPAVCATVTGAGLVLVVAAGLRISAWAWSGITVAKLVPLVLLIGAWLLATSTGRVEAVSAPANPPALSGLLRAAFLAMFALQGFEIVPVPAQHVRNPNAIARATVLVLLIAPLLYVALHFACASALAGLSESRAPMVEAARVYGGASLGQVLYVGTNVSALGIALGMIAMSPRYLSTLGRSDGLGEWFGTSDDRGVPRRALFITGLVVLVLVQVGSLDELFAMSSIAVLLQYGSTAAALVWLGRRRVLGLGRMDVVLGGIALVAAVLVGVGASLWEILRAFAVIALGVVVKLVVNRKRRAA